MVSSRTCCAFPTISLFLCSSSNSKSDFSCFAFLCSSIASIRCFLSLAFALAASVSCFSASLASSYCPTGAAALFILSKSEAVRTIESISTLVGFLVLAIVKGALALRSPVLGAENKLSSTPPSVLLYRPTDFCDALDRLDPSDDTERWLARGCRKSDL